MQEKLQEKEETALGLQENFVSLQQEVDIKTKKLKKVNELSFNINGIYNV